MTVIDNDLSIMYLQRPRLSKRRQSIEHATGWLVTIIIKRTEAAEFSLLYSLQQRQTVLLTMTATKNATRSRGACKRAVTGRHQNVVMPPRSVRFSIKPSPEIVGDKFLQSTDNRRRYMRRGSRSPNMLALHAVRLSAEVAQIEAYDADQEKLEAPKCFPSTDSTTADCCHDQSLTNHIRRSMSLPGKRKIALPKEIVDTELARSLFQKTHLTGAQKRRVSLEILSRVEL